MSTHNKGWGFLGLNKKPPRMEALITNYLSFSLIHQVF